jgi:hypothetical protein
MASYLEVLKPDFSILRLVIRKISMPGTLPKRFSHLLAHAQMLREHPESELAQRERKLGR